MTEQKNVSHPLAPILDENSRILILGTMPSPKSREQMFYYAHPQNRFWPVLAAVLGEELPPDAAGKTAMLKKHGIALWDVLASCEIRGASDSSIRNAVPNDIAALIKGTGIRAIFTTGMTAFRYYRRFCEKEAGITAIPLPSPSAANAKMTKETLIDAYKILRISLNQCHCSATGSTS